MRPAQVESASGFPAARTPLTLRSYERPANLDALLVRPDGYVAWVARTDNRDDESQRTLRAALERRFGTAAR